jgi:hypothetical protein
MKKIILLIMLFLIGCGEPNPSNIPQSLYKKGDIVCLKLTNQKVLISNVDIDYEPTYWVIIDYTNRGSVHSFRKHVGEFELCSCNTL